MKLLTLLAIPLWKVMGQHYFIDVNGTNYNQYISQDINHHQMPVFEYDEVLHHYRSDIRKREPKFLGFDINDDNIEVRKWQAAKVATLK